MLVYVGSLLSGQIRSCDSGGREAGCCNFRTGSQVPFGVRSVVTLNLSRELPVSLELWSPSHLLLLMGDTGDSDGHLLLIGGSSSSSSDELSRVKSMTSTFLFLLD